MAALLFVLWLVQQVGQLGDVGGDCVAGHRAWPLIASMVDPG